MSQLNGADVLIVGAGPTGMTLAFALQRAGVSFDLVERRAEPAGGSKAVAINAATQLCFAWLGLQRVVADARAVHGANVYCGLNRISHVDTRLSSTEHSRFLVQPQWVTEHALRAELTRAGVPLAWGHEVLDVAQTDSDVRVELREPSGSISRRSYRYVVGCEGKHSVVRRAMQSEFEGTGYDTAIVLADVPLAPRYFGTEAHYYVFEREFIIVVPLPGELYRVVLQEPVEPGPNAASDVSKVLRERFGSDAVIGEVGWTSRAELYMSVAEPLRRGRLFIAGDAAHLYSPIGGTGMNTGIQDAWNLAWKLASVAHGEAAPEPLLGSYGAERGAAVRAGAAGTDLLTRLITRRPTPARALSNLLPLSEHSLAERAERSARLVGIAQQYPRGEFVLSAETASPTIVGQLAWFVEQFPELVAARDSLGRGQHLLVLNPRAGEAHALAPWLSRATDPRIGCIAMSPDRLGLAEPSQGNAREASRRSLTVGAPAPGTATLVRPDGVVALCAPLDSPRVLEAYLNQLGQVCAAAQ